MAAAISGVSNPSASLVPAACFLISPSARINARGKRRLLMGKFSSARAVCARTTHRAARSFPPSNPSQSDTPYFLLIIVIMIVIVIVIAPPVINELTAPHIISRT